MNRIRNPEMSTIVLPASLQVEPELVVLAARPMHLQARRCIVEDDLDVL